jgi:hypothetical protein
MKDLYCSESVFRVDFLSVKTNSLSIGIGRFTDKNSLNTLQSVQVIGSFMKCLLDSLLGSLNTTTKHVTTSSASYPFLSNKTQTTNYQYDRKKILINNEKIFLKFKKQVTTTCI